MIGIRKRVAGPRRIRDEMLQVEGFKYLGVLLREGWKRGEVIQHVDLKMEIQKGSWNM